MFYESKVCIIVVMHPVQISTSEMHTHFILAVACNCDATVIATGGADDVVKLWDAYTGKFLNELKGHTDYVQAVVFSPIDKDLLVSGGRDGKILLWSALEGRQLKNALPAGHDSAVRSICFNSAGLLIASSSGAQTSSERQDNSVRIWSISSGTEELLIPFHTAPVASVAWHPALSILASASRDRIVGLHFLGDQAGVVKKSTALRGHTDYVNAVAWSLCGGLLASASSDRSVRVWDTVSGQALQVCRHDMLCLLCMNTLFATNSVNRILVASSDKAGACEQGAARPHLHCLVRRLAPARRHSCRILGLGRARGTARGGGAAVGVERRLRRAPRRRRPRL